MKIKTVRHIIRVEASQLSKVDTYPFSDPKLKPHILTLADTVNEAILEISPSWMIFTKINFWASVNYNLAQIAKTVPCLFYYFPQFHTLEKEDQFLNFIDALKFTPLKSKVEYTNCYWGDDEDKEKFELKMKRLMAGNCGIKAIKCSIDWGKEAFSILDYIWREQF
jgi:hypothetical protein